MIVAYYDTDGLPLAWAAGPASEQVLIERMAQEILAKQCKKMNIDPESFTKKIIKL